MGLALYFNMLGEAPDMRNKKWRLRQAQACLANRSDRQHSPRIVDSIFSRPMTWPGCRFLNGRQIFLIYTVAVGGGREKISRRASQLKIPRHSPFSKQKVKPIAVDAIGARIEDN